MKALLLLLALAGSAHANIGNIESPGGGTSTGTHTDGGSASFSDVTAANVTSTGTLKCTGAAPCLTINGGVSTSSFTVLGGASISSTIYSSADTNLPVQIQSSVTGLSSFTLTNVPVGNKGGVSLRLGHSQGAFADVAGVNCLINDVDAGNRANCGYRISYQDSLTWGTWLVGDNLRTLNIGAIGTGTGAGGDGAKLAIWAGAGTEVARWDGFGTLRVAAGTTFSTAAVGGIIGYEDYATAAATTTAASASIVYTTFSVVTIPANVLQKRGDSLVLECSTVFDSAASVARNVILAAEGVVISSRSLAMVGGTGLGGTTKSRITRVSAGNQTFNCLMSTGGNCPVAAGLTMNGKTTLDETAAIKVSCLASNATNVAGETSFLSFRVDYEPAP